MPYIPEPCRTELLNGRPPHTAGELNFLMFTVGQEYWEHHGRNYQAYNDFVGAIELAKQEIYRRCISTYEQAAARLNGDLRGLGIEWAAGFFDGEGCTTHTLQRRRDGTLRPKGRVAMSVGQKTPLLLLRFAEAVGVGPVYNNKTQNAPWRWSIQRYQDVYEVSRLLWPHIGLPKRLQALEALQKYHDERSWGLESLPPSAMDDWPNGDVHGFPSQ